MKHSECMWRRQAASPDPRRAVLQARISEAPCQSREATLSRSQSPVLSASRKTLLWQSGASHLNSKTLHFLNHKNVVIKPLLFPEIIQLNTSCTQLSMLQMPSSIEIGMSFNIKKAVVQIHFLYSFNSPIILWPSIYFLECIKECLVFKTIIQCILCHWYFLITLFGKLSRNGILP